MAEHLPVQCGALCRDEYDKVLNGDFKMSLSSTYKSAAISLDTKENKKSIYFKLHELRYTSYIFFMVKNQLIKYIEAMSDVINYVLSSISSNTYVEPSSDANKNILYYQLFVELKLNT